MKFGIAYCYWNKDWEGNDYPRYVERARKCGFDGLEIVYGRLPQMGRSEIDEIRAACREYDIELYATGGFGRDMDVSSFDEDVRRHAVKESIRLLKAFESLDIHNFSGINYGAWSNFDGADRKEELFEQAAKSLREIGPAAEASGVSWNMEVVNRFESCLLNTAEEAMKLVRMVDHPAVNVLLDIFHGMIEEDDLAEAVRIVGKDRLGHYHLGTNNRRLPQPGFLPWAEVCGALREIGYERCLSFEPLVHCGGTVTKNGGNVWRPMLPAGITDEEMDEQLRQSLAFMRSML